MHYKFLDAFVQNIFEVLYSGGKSQTSSKTEISFVDNGENNSSRE